MSFSDANAFGERVKEAYIKLGYTIVEVPFCSPKERAQFIINEIRNQNHE